LISFTTLLWVMSTSMRPLPTQDPSSRSGQQAECAVDAPVQRAHTEPSFVHGLRVIESRELLQQRRELLIRHGNECYRLRLTRQDKLILTK
jgi:hemin uptake protein HemP